MKVAVLALQGAFIEHEKMLERLGIETFEIRQLADWSKPKDGLIIPGGESTVQARLLKDLGLLGTITDDIRDGLPVFGTCAGLILLAKEVENSEFGRFSTMDISVLRNAYGRQLGSFYAEDCVKGIGDDVPMTFIRAPYIKSAGKGVDVLATVGGHIVAARQANQLVTSFHPELNEDTRVHQYFVEMMKKQK